MAPKASTSKSKTEDGEDLNSILDRSQRADLTLLIADITESMRNLIMNNFDATAGLDPKKVGRENMTEEEKIMAADPHADIDKIEKQKKLQEEYEKDLATLKMRNLKKNSLKAFDVWREKVLQRIGQVVNSETSAQEQIETSKTTDTRPNAPKSTGKISQASKRSTNLRFKDLYPPTKTRLTKLPMDRRTLILHAVLLLLLSLEHYNAASRVLLLNLTASLKLPLKTFEQDEYVTAKGLLEYAKELTASEETRKRAEENQGIRKQRVKYATIAGAAIIGVAGGFAAPLLAAGIGSVASGLGLGTTAAAGYLGAVASSSIVVGSLFGAYGGRMTGRMMDRYAKEVEDFEFLPVHSNQRTSEDPEAGAKEASEHDHKLRVTICLSGWLTEKEEVIKPWRVVGSGAEVFALKYELEALLNLGNAMDGMVQSAAWSYAQKELIQRTVFADLMAAMWPLGLLKVARVIDNPFSLAKARAEKVGEVLADVLVNRAQGERPVTLIGYSLGARAIYVCLQSLAARKAFNLVENAVLIGAPTPSDTSDWRLIRSVVSGRLVNVYSTNDYILGFMYRTSAIQYGVAGLQPVEGLAGVENVDVSEDVDGHLRYRFLIGGILKKIGFEDIDMQAVDEEQEELQRIMKEEKKNSMQARRRRLMRTESYKKDGKIDEDAQAEDEASELEQQVKEKTESSLISRVIDWWYSPRALDTNEAKRVAGTLTGILQNPSQVSGAAKDTLSDAQQAGSSMVQKVYQALPNIPYVGSSGTSGNTGKGATSSQEGEKKTAHTQSYTSRAAEYLPKNMPSMPSMPSLPSITGSTKKKDTASKPAKAAKAAGETTKNTTSAAADTVGTTVKNTVNVKDNPATKQVKQAPIIHQTLKKDPGVHQTLGKATDVVSTSVAKITDTATKGVDTALDQAGKGGGKTVDAADKGVKKAGEAGKTAAGTVKSQDAKEKNKQAEQTQSYTSYAASYIPSLPSWRKTPNKEGKPGPPTRKPSAPKLERKGSSQVKSSSSQPRPAAPKLERSQSSTAAKDLKSPPPKLGSRKASERGVLEHTASEKETPSNVATDNTGVTSKAARVSEGVVREGGEKVQQLVSQGPKGAVKGRDAAGQVASKGKEVASTSASAATGAVGGAFGGARRMMGFGK